MSHQVFIDLGIFVAFILTGAYLLLVLYADGGKGKKDEFMRRRMVCFYKKKASTFDAVYFVKEF